ncbi:MAG: hypothetical protein GC168_08930 [Candidatus Hydrogenedens sp.]|nr:hypothetical protein [Candidatus Hydrogenedens sp.]
MTIQLFTLSTALLLLGAAAANTDSVAFNPCTTIEFQHELQARVQQRMLRDDAARQLQGGLPAAHEKDVNYRFYTLLLDELERYAGDGDIAPLQWMWGDALHHANDKHARIEAHRSVVRTESIEAAVAHLWTSGFQQDCAHMRFTMTFAFSGDLNPPPKAFASDLLMEPRIARLVAVARKGSEHERQRLLAAMKGEFQARGLVLPMLNPPPMSWPGISGRPLAALPLLIATLDAHGEQLDFLIEMACRYAQAEDEAAFEQALLNGERFSDPFGKQLAYAIEMCLENAENADTESPQDDLYRRVEQALKERHAEAQTIMLAKRFDTPDYPARWAVDLTRGPLEAAIPAVVLEHRTASGDWKALEHNRLALAIARGYSLCAMPSRTEH